MTLWQKHATAAGIMAALATVHLLGRSGIESVHLYNRAFADASFVTLCLALAMGPIARISPRTSPALQLRREVGIWSTVAAVLHVAIYASVHHFNPVGFFARYRPDHGWILLDTNVALANWVGLPALVLALLLAATSNDASQRLLGRGWRQLQEESFTLFVLVVIHTAFFVHLVQKTGRGIFRVVFWSAVLATLLLRLARFVRNARRG